MNEDKKNHRIGNILHTVLLMAGLLALLAVIGWLFAGIYGIGASLLLGFVPLFISVRIMPSLTLKMYGAKPLSAEDSPQIFSIVRALSARAGFLGIPRLYYISNKAPLIFSVGQGREGAIALSEGILQLLSLRELVSVIGHEISHIRNNDTLVMSIADIISRITSTLSFVGQLLLIINLPLLLLGGHPMPWIPVLLMLLAPTLSGLMQLALSRTREHNADYQGARLTGDPEGLATALGKLEEYQKTIMKQLLLPGKQGVEPSLLRTHPRTEERIRRLHDLAHELEREERLY